MLAVAFSSLLVQLGGEAFVDPKDYVSPSGAYVLHVEPSARDGAGPGEYRMIRAGELVWSSRLPFTLHEAALTDSGATVGYAYDGGAEETEGNFREVLLAPDGRVLLDARTERRLSRWGCWPPPEPRALGLVVDEPNDRFVVRIADDDPARGKELWRAYQLSTGEKLAELRPQEGLPRNEYDYVEISAVRPVRDTGLFLLHEFHWRCDSGPSGSECPTGGFFALIELGGRVVWQLQLPHDYEIEGTDSERWIFAWSVCEKGAILDFPAPRTFDLRFVQEGQRVRFMASPAPDSESGWTVAELGRRPWEAPDGKVAKASGRSTGAVGREAHERIELRELATVALERSARPAPAIRDVEAWSFTEDGGFQFVRRDERVYSIVEVDREGRLLREVSLEPLPADGTGRLSWSWLGSDKWLVTSSGRGHAYLAEARSGALDRLVGFDGVPAKKVVSMAGGEWVILGSHRLEDRKHALLAGFDSSGARLWTGGPLGEREGLPRIFPANDVTVTTDGRIVTLGAPRKELQEFTGDGRFLRTIELEHVVGSKPRYPGGISAGPHGSVLVCDFHGDPALWHIAADGTLLRGITPRFEDGRPANARQARFSSEGELWTCDSFSFQQLDENGIVRRVVGEELLPDAIFQVGAHAIDELGRPCLQDFRTGAVHVWSPDGRKLFTGRIDPAAAQDLDRKGWIRAGPDGSVYVSRGVADVRLTHWSPSGEFVGELEPGGNRFVFDRNGRRWVWQYRKGLRLLDENDSVLAAVDHAPDGSWIREIGDVTVGSDGTLAVLDQPLVQPKVLLYSALGEPLGAHELPVEASRKLFKSISISRSWIAVSTWDATTVLLRRSGGAPLIFDPELPEQEPSTRCPWNVALSPDGSELRLFATPELTLRRYALP